MSALSSSMSGYGESDTRPNGQDSSGTKSSGQPLTRSSIADYIGAAAAPHVSDNLISPEALSNICGIASVLPGALSDFFGFECPLGLSQPRADFLLCCRASQGGREVLNGRGPGQNLPAFFHAHPIWQRIRSFSDDWSNPQSPLFDRVHNMWIEFDVEGVPSCIPVPSVFIGPESLKPLESTVETGGMPSHCAWLTDLALPLLRGSEPDEKLTFQIARCLKSLPSGARIFQVGLMLARASRATRLCVRGVSGAQIIEYLRALDYDTSTGELEGLINLLEPLVARMDLDIDVVDGVLPRIGLECYLPMGSHLTERYLNHLVSSGLATLNKAEALKSWPGMAHERLAPDIWPRDLLAVSGFLGGRVHSGFARWLHHVKIVYQPGVPLEAKAYLAVRHMWVAPETIKDLLKVAQSRIPEQEG